MTNSYDVMISYSSEDARVTDEIVEAIESRGFRCWLASRDAQAGEDYEQEIVSAIENTPALVLVFSHTSNASRHVHREIVLADSESKTVFPLRIEDFEPTGMMRYQLSNRQRLDYFRDKKRAIETIHARLLALGCTPNKAAPAQQRPNNPYGAAPPPAPVAPPAPRSTDVIPESSDGLRHFLPPALDPLFLLFDWRGRIGRRSYLFGFLLELFFGVLAVYVILASATYVHSTPRTLEDVGKNFVGMGIGVLIFLSIMLFAFVFCNFVLAAKRLHDLGVSAWWYLLPFGLQALSLLVSFLATQVVSASFIELEIGLVGTLFSLWMILWPGGAAENQYGPAPNFKRDWKPYNVVATRASARSEFDLPFVALSFEGRIGQKGVAMGTILILWFCAFAANIGYYIDYTDAISLLAKSFFEQGLNLGLLGTLRGLQMSDALKLSAFLLEVISLFGAGLVFASVVSKRLHDLNLSSWFMAPGVFALLTGVAAVTMFISSPNVDIIVATTLSLVALVTGVLFFWPGDKDFNAYGPPPGFRATVLRAQHSVRA